MESSDSSSSLRNTVFSTINLINDLESGNHSKSSQNHVRNQTHNNQNKDVTLSNNFVDGIKNKMINPSRVIESTKSDSVNANELKNQVKSYIDSNLNSLHEIIKSQAIQIQSLNDEISELKKSVEHNHSVTDSFNQQQNDLDNSNNSEPSMISFNENNNGFSSNENLSHDNSTQNKSDSVFSMYEENTEMIHQSNSENKIQELSKSNEQESKPISNPRVGNYSSNDVSIEKYFYCGNK